MLLLCASFNGFTQGRTPETIETDFWLNNEWLFVLETNYTFNTSCFPLVGIAEALNFTTNDFDTVTRATNTYDSENRITEFILELWNASTMQWDNSARVTFDYDGDNLLESFSYNWVDNLWQPDTRTNAGYNDNDIAESITERYIPETGTWVNETRSMYQYNNDGLLELFIEQIWENAWVTDREVTSEYNANQLLSVSTIVERDIISGNLVNNRRTTFTYNAFERPIEEEQEIWVDGIWVNLSLDTSTYDANNFLIESVKFEWNETLMLYEPKLRSLYTRNDEGLSTVVVSQTFEGTWVNSSRDRNTYPECSTLSVESLSDTQLVQVYPNPAKDFIVISFKENVNYSVSIYDMNGRKMYTDYLKDSYVTIDTSKLSKGMYMMEFKNNNGSSFVKKIIID